MADPAWLAKMQPASFRGVPFKFSRVRRPQAGRRIVEHEYPDVDAVDPEDLGAKPRRFTLEGWVIGPAYFGDRDNLEAALDQPGPGVLVHPYRGPLTVVVLDFEVEETTEEGGMAHFSMAFLQFAPPAQPAVTFDTAAQVESNVAIVKSFQAPMLASRMNLLRYFDVSEAVAQVTDLLRPFGQLSAQIQAIIEDPKALIALIRGLVSTFTDFGGLVGLFSSTTNSLASTTSSQANRAALQTAVQVEAILAAAAVSSATTYDSANAALAARDQLLAAIDAIAGAVDDDTFAALQDLRRAVVDDIGARAANLAVLATVVLQESLPSCVLANRLYGPVDVENSAADICARNRVMDPDFLPSGIPLEVLSAWPPA